MAPFVMKVCSRKLLKLYIYRKYKKDGCVWELALKKQPIYLASM
jgi:hypothetical protein